MLEIDFEKLSKVSMLQAYEELDAFLESPKSTNCLIKWEKRNLDSEEQMKNTLLEMYGMCLLQNYHMALIEILMGSK